jgi:hypothetical protein
MEEWLPIEDFPDYVVSNFGQVMNVHTDRILVCSIIKGDVPIIGLMKDQRQYKRSLAGLVARAFLPEPERDDFNTPIHLDGDKVNCSLENLAWRPRAFAINFHLERKSPVYPNWDQDIRLMDTYEVFSKPAEAAVKYGILERDIHRSIVTGMLVFPHNFLFELD